MLNIIPQGHYLDCTGGFGGHSSAILEKLRGGHLYITDMDKYAYDYLLKEFGSEENVTVMHINYKNFRTDRPLDGILLDLGISSYHVDDGERGFSFRTDAPLDMRMDRTSPFSLIQWIKQTDVPVIAQVIEQYSDEKRAMDIAKAIKRRANKDNMNTTFDLKDAVIEGTGGRGVKYSLRRVFQALRILTNDEMNSLHQFLERVPSLLKPGGRLAVLTYHSIEDRTVKHTLRNMKNMRIVNKRVIKPHYTEIKDNKRARSAQLRGAERV
ncbi:MAG: 16S rRNA (cytosine(1402)-N(4))-methyltransferase RsmH [bacterium]